MPRPDRLPLLLAHVRAAGGVVRSAAARAAGHPQRVIAAAVEAGALLRIRRVWLAVPDADAYLLAAARAGVVVSCVTAAARLGLWTLDAGEVSHVAASASAGRISPAAGTRVHRAKPLVPRHPEALVDPLENVLALVAACLPFEQALAIWESALRKGMTDAAILRGLALRGPARHLAEIADPFSDSGLESFVPGRLRFLGLRILKQIWIAGHHVDFLIGDRLVLQIDGGHHVGRQRTSDIRHDAALMLRGYHVIRVGYSQVVDDWPSVHHDIMLAVAMRRHLAT